MPLLFDKKSADESCMRAIVDEPTKMSRAGLRTRTNQPGCATWSLWRTIGSHANQLPRQDSDTRRWKEEMKTAFCSHYHSAKGGIGTYIFYGLNQARCYEFGFRLPLSVIGFDRRARQHRLCLAMDT